LDLAINEPDYTHNSLVDNKLNSTQFKSLIGTITEDDENN